MSASRRKTGRMYMLTCCAWLFYYQRNDLEYTFFQTYFQNFGNKIFNNFCNFSQIPMKYHHFDITPIKITEILWNPEEIRWKFDKDLQNLLSFLKFGENCVKFCEKWCKGPEKSEKSGMVQRKKGELEKRWKMRPWTQKSALIQPKTSLGKGLKNVYSKGPRWLY